MTALFESSQRQRQSPLMGLDSKQRGVAGRGRAVTSPQHRLSRVGDGPPASPGGLFGPPRRDAMPLRRVCPPATNGVSMSIGKGGTSRGPGSPMNHGPKPLPVAILFMALLAWSWPAMPAGCASWRPCAAMHGGAASCEAWRSDSGCCHFRAPMGQPPSETRLSGPAAAAPFLLAALVPDSPRPERLLPVDRPSGVLRPFAPPLYLLHASFLI